MIGSHKKRPQTTLLVDGIRCNHCEGSIKLALGKVPGVSRVSIHKRKKVTIEFETANIPEDELKLAIESAGYQVINSP